MKKSILFPIIAFALAVIFLVALAESAQATDTGQVCAGLDSGKIDTTGDPATVTMTATPGYEITRYCIKAGSAKQGDGPVYVNVNPPQTSITVGHPSGKDVSHYSWQESKIEVPPTTVPTTDPPVTTNPPTTVATTVPPTTAPPSTEPPSTEPPSSSTSVPPVTAPPVGTPVTTIPDECWIDNDPTNVIESPNFTLYGPGDPNIVGTHSISGMNCGPFVDIGTPPVPPTELPSTGGELHLAGLAAALLAAGAGLAAVARRSATA